MEEMSHTVEGEEDVVSKDESSDDEKDFLENASFVDVECLTDTDDD